MSKEKQIEGMTKFILELDTYTCEECDKCGKWQYEDQCDDTCFSRKVAESLYASGYRKQSEGEWKDCFNGEYANPTYVCSICGKGALLELYISELGNMQIVQALSPFCPHCGAKMKGGAE